MTCDEDDLRTDFSEYSQALAYKMADAGITRVKYDTSGVKFREKNDWDFFFEPSEDPIDKIIREGVPLSRKGNLWFWKHKSYLEFFVAQIIYEKITKYDILLRKKNIKLLFRELKRATKNTELEFMKHVSDEFLVKWASDFKSQAGSPMRVPKHDKSRESKIFADPNLLENEKDIIVNETDVQTLLQDSNAYKDFRLEFSGILVKRGLLNVQKSSRLEYACNMLDQFRGLIGAIESYNNIMNIIGRMPNVVTKF